MKIAPVVLGLLLWASLGAWAPKETPEALRAKAIADAAPYVMDALTKPIDALYANGISGDGHDFLRMGLAMFAGRELGPDGPEDEAALAELEARVLPLSDAYVEAHPNLDTHKVDWRKVMKATSKDLAFVAHYQKRHSADDWLYAASNARDVHAGYNISRPMHFENAAPPTENTTQWPLIDHRLFLTAAGCVRAVRIAAGHSYHGSRDLPVSVYLLREDFGADLDRTLATAAPDASIATGADACGTADQFQAYVAMLKAAG